MDELLQIETDQVVDRYLQDTANFTKLLTDTVNEVDSKYTELKRQGESLVQKESTLHSDHIIMIEKLRQAEMERDEAVFKVNVATKLGEKAKEDLQRAEEALSEVAQRSQDLDEQETRLKKQSHTKQAESQSQDKLKEELAKLRKELEAKEVFIKAQQTLLNDKQKSLDDKAVRLMKFENKLKIIRNKK